MPPPPGSVERWAYDFVTGVDLERKLAPPPPPDAWQEGAPPRRLDQPGRPPGLVVATSSPRTPGRDALRDGRRRAQLFHTFLHHELQAAELMAWALLAFPAAPAALRRGFLRVALDEIRHVGLYGDLLAGLGYRVGDFPVRDWFWQRVPSCASVEQFLAVMGVGFEGGNLDHAPRFAARLREAGDPAGARVQEVIGEEEIAHVHLATTWLGRLGGGLRFAAWGALLPPPLSPMLFRGKPLNLRDRARAGFDADFLGALDAWQPEPSAGVGPAGGPAGKGPPGPSAGVGRAGSPAGVGPTGSHAGVDPAGSPAEGLPGPSAAAPAAPEAPACDRSPGS
ncbi:MAG TPA: DUF455 family protein [Polyangiaceae bacterium]|nr:DUF455 family protein [Polyangiaceae bacterium]